jgi:hypothetical protein
MSIISQAKFELEKANIGEEESAVLLTILGTFFAQFDSGGAVYATIPILQRLLCGQPLTPLTGEDDEWYEPFADGDAFQNKRCSSVFKTKFSVPHFNLSPGDAYDIDSKKGIEKITFPYLPPMSGNISPPTMDI